jgi:GNAT superfamily N-acetyltransferase
MSVGAAEVLVHPLSPELSADWLAFFDHDAFADNPDWSGCYCHFFHADHNEKDWQCRTSEENRAASIRLIEAGRLQGYLAYADGRPVGWCQAAPRLAIPNLADDPDLAVDDAAEVGSIVCFLVAESFRRRGVAGALLEAACVGFRVAGLRVAEAYPSRTATSDATNYHGPLALYLRVGFTAFRELKDRVLVRRGLR